MRQIIIPIILCLVYQGCTNNKNDFPYPAGLNPVKNNLNPVDLYSYEISKCAQYIPDIIEKTEFAESKNLFLDSRSYFLSEQFERDYKNKKFNAGISVFLPNGSPLSLSGNANENEIKEFRQKIESVESVTINESWTRSWVAERKGNERIAELYFNCIAQENDKFGLSFRNLVRIKEKGGYTIKGELLFTDHAQLGIKLLIKEVEIVGLNLEKKVIESLKSKFKPGTQIVSLKFAFTTQSSNSICINIATNKPGLSASGFIEAYSEETQYNYYSEVPLGTVITSYLDFGKFNIGLGNCKDCKGERIEFDPKCSKWAPCNGKNITGSKLYELTNRVMTSAPDLRGVFIRGLNSFENPNDESKANSTQLNPETIGPGGFQKDTIKIHKHKIGVANVDKQSGQDTRFLVGKGRGDHTVANTNDYGGNETRPKNVSLFYYIKINP